jgi:hypothetical protein
MRGVYRVLAFLVAAEVAVQAMFIVWGDAGMGLFVENGGVIDKATFESAFEGGEAPFPEFIAFLFHGMNGMMVIPALALLLVISSFFAKVPRGVTFALAVLGLVVLQVTLGLMGHSVAILGAFHGINALLLFSTAMWTGLRVARMTRAAHAESRTERVPV